MADAKITALTELTSVTNSDLLAVVDDPGGSPITKKATVGNVMSASGLVLTLPQINDTSSDHQYVFGVSELTADRTVTLPLLTGNDEFVFKDHTQTLTNKTLTAPKLADGGFIADANGNEVIKATTTTDAVNEITVIPSATGNAVEIEATGGDTNIDLKLSAKGTGGIQDKNGDYIGPNSSMARQAIINGNFDVWQRGTSSTPGTTTVAFLADRFRVQQDADGGTLPTVVHSRQSLTPGDVSNSFFHYRIATNGAGTSLGVNSFGVIGQTIENGTRYLCGNGKKVTVSFWAKSDIASKKLGISLNQGYGSGGSPTATEYIAGSTISITSSWTKYTVTFTTNTLSGKTFGTANNDSLELVIWQMWGATLGAARGLTGSETYVGSGNIDIAQVQLCAGDVALPFMPKSFEEELRACMRYYEKSYQYAVIPGSSNADGVLMRRIESTDSYAPLPPAFFKVSKRNVSYTFTCYSPITGTSGKARNFAGNADVDVALCGDGAGQDCLSEQFYQPQVNNVSITSGYSVGYCWTCENEL